MNLQENDTDRAIIFDKKRGIVFGNADYEDLKINLQIMCKNSEGLQELALEFTSNF